MNTLDWRFVYFKLNGHIMADISQLLIIFLLNHSMIHQNNPDLEILKMFNIYHLTLRDWSLIMGRGATKWENCLLKLFAPPPPPPQDSKTFRPPPFQMVKTLCGPPPPLWPKLQATMQDLLYPNSFCAPPPPSEWLQLPPPPPFLFVGVKLHLPPFPFCRPPPRNL